MTTKPDRSGVEGRDADPARHVPDRTGAASASPVRRAASASPARRAAGVIPGIVAGLLTAAVALGVAQLVAGITGSEGSPVVAVGRAAIDLTPRPVTDFAIRVFGTHDKQVLLSVIIVALAVFAAGFGIAAMRRLAAGFTGLAVFAAIGLLAVVTRPDFTPVDVAPTLAGAAVGAYALVRFARTARRGAPGRVAAQAADRAATALAAMPPDATAPDATAPGTMAGPPDRGPGGQVSAAAPGRDRRAFLVTGAVAVTGAAASGVLGNVLAQRSAVSDARANLHIRRPDRPAPALAATDDLRITGLSPFVTPSGSFYRVDTALLIPQVSPASWRLRVHGMVNRELHITFADLVRRPLTEADITLCCVSNPVGGPYIGNARWLGVSLASLLRDAGIRPGADQLLSTSSDGYTSGTPVATVMDGRNALLAIAMNGAALPIAHGFPARMIVPGLYGYVSATKWVTDIKVTTFAAEQGYWIKQGWAARGPIKTESRIDVPTPNKTLKQGRVAVAGVAWAQHRGIEAVQVRADRGPWHEARLATVPGIDTWRQWVWDWDATPGAHQLQVRATDKTGYTQTPVPVGPYPNGSTGWHTVTVKVTA